MPSVWKPGEWASATHIWLSHEHPDHFSPASLRTVPETDRRHITVLFQETRDRRVATWCAKAGFPVRELREHRWINLGPGCDVMLGRVPFFDSWLATRADGHCVLNLNDCVLYRRRDLEVIAARVGPVDTLLSQFSYASWFGNPEDAHLRRAAADQKLGWLRLQIETIAPRQTIPFASFTRFSHASNAYLNDCLVPVERAVEVIEKAGSRAVVLFPGDHWTAGGEHDSTPAIARYAKAATEHQRLHESEPVPVKELEWLADAYVARIREKNNRLWVVMAALPPVRFLRPLRMYVCDHETTVEFDTRRGLRVIGAGEQRPDIALHSESLAFVLRHEWGADTLSVGGRLRECAPGGYRRFLRVFSLGMLNNTGRKFGFGLVRDFALIRRGLSKFIGSGT